mmetsp:Transcript_100992/g.326019  ORF Transcript_100992/g.326019 Transcript_100992/m.326019 type:complete len:80 (+) Transcript_100992:132-371(+)
MHERSDEGSKELVTCVRSDADVPVAAICWPRPIKDQDDTAHAPRRARECDKCLQLQLRSGWATVTGAHRGSPDTAAWEH